jgi:hypothetical protein
MSFIGNLGGAMRYLDDLKAKGFRMMDGDFDYTDEIVAINGQSLADLIPSILAHNLEIREEDLNFAPPFSVAAVEYLHKVPGLKAFRVMCLAESIDGKKEKFGEFCKELGIEYDEDKERWSTHLRVYCDIGVGDPLEPTYDFMLTIATSGKLTYKMDSILNREQPFTAYAMRSAAPYFLATTFLNCKNSHLEEIPNSPSYERRFSKWNMIPATQYKEIKVYPVGKRTHTGVVGESGIRQGLHIARGHFKDYRERGLFGKMKGIYWWASTLRGDLDRGVIDKTYNVSPVPRSVRSANA